MESFFEGIENIGAWESYIRTFQTIGVTDEELSAAMIDAIFISNEELLYRLIADTRSGRRVFKQLCRKGTVPHIVSLDLHTRQELDLAFNVVVGKRLWSYALELYHHPDVTQRSRRQALQCAIREGSWDTVKQLVVSSVTPERDRRQAFLAAVRQNELAWAVHLCEQGVSVFDGDIRFAIKTCLATSQNQFLHIFLQLCHSDTGKYKGLKCILKESIHSNAVLVLTENHQLSIEHGTYVDLRQPRSIQASAIHTDFPAIEGYYDFLGSSTHDDGSRLVENTAIVYEVYPQTQGSTTGTGSHTTENIKDLQMYMICQAVTASNAECFRSLCFQVAENETMLSYAFRKAIRAGKIDLVMRAIDIHENNGFQHRRMVRLVVKLGMKTEKSEFVKTVVESHSDCVSWVDFFVFETDFIKASKKWPVAISIVDSLIQVSPNTSLSELIDGVKWKIGYYKVKLLARWCMENACSSLALLIAVDSGLWRRAKRIIGSMSAQMPLDLFHFVFGMSVSEGAWAVAVACLKHAPGDAELEPYYTYWGHSWDILIQHCFSEGLKNWGVKLAVWAGSWQIVETEIEHCDKPTFNFVLQEAASISEWGVVSKLLDRCTGSEPCLHEVLRSAIEMGECECAKKLLNMVDPLADETFTRPLLNKAVGSQDEDMINLCIQAGVSTHQQPGHLLCSPVEQALNGYFQGSILFSVIRALFESGACSHVELRHLKNDTMLKSRLASRQQTEVLEFMEEASSTPRSLQSLCRLSVSHQIGCQPGRENRILSLPVPQRIKDFIMFKDILVASPSPEFGSDTDEELTGLL